MKDELGTPFLKCKAYGIVWQAVDKKTKQTVAVKKIFDAFRNKTDALRTYREVMFLREFSFHPNIIKLLKVIKADNDLDLYLVLEYMDSDLHNVIKRGNILKDIHQRYIMFQLLNALKCLHSLNVIHRDLKPSNILLDADCHVRVADFGLARSLSQPEIEDEGDPTLTEYVATRWYRAPEILLADKFYTTGVDTWSIGCILGEMLLGKPLFPGTSTLNQIEKIMCSINHPTFQDIRNMCSGYALSVLERASNRPKRPIRDMIPGAPEDALDLLTKLLVFNPKKRISTEQASEHPYVKRFSSSIDISSKIPSAKFAHSFSENENHMSVDGYRQKLYQLIKYSGLDGHQTIENVLPCNIETHKDDPPESDSAESEDFPSPDSSARTTKSNRKTVLHSSTDSLHSNRLIRNNWIEPDNINNAASNRFGSSSSPHLRKAISQECVRNSMDIANRDNLFTSALSPPKTSETLFHGLPPAGLPSHHPRANTSSAWLRYHRGPLINSEIVHHHLNNKKQLSSCSKGLPKERPKQFGRKQFGNHSNVSSLGSPKSQMQSYAQSHGTIAASAFDQLRLT